MYAARPGSLWADAQRAVTEAARSIFKGSATSVLLSCLMEITTKETGSSLGVFKRDSLEFGENAVVPVTLTNAGEAGGAAERG